MSVATPPAVPAATPPAPAPARRSPLRRAFGLVLWPFRVVLAVLRSFWTWLLVLLVVLVAVVAYYIIADRDTPLTTDAYVQAYVVRIAPQVSGRVVRVLVGEGSPVRTGDVLFGLDHRPFASKVALLEAKGVSARTQVQQLSSELAAEQEALRRNEAQNENGATEVPLCVGMTCTVTTYADPASSIAPANRLIQRVVAWWYYF